MQLNPENASFREGQISPIVDVGFEMGMDADGGKEEAYKLWEKKYVFVKMMVPGFVSEDFAKKVGHLIESWNHVSIKKLIFLYPDFLYWSESELYQV